MTCILSVGIVEKRTVAINFWINPLVENMSDSARVECAGKLCAVRVLNAMHRPQDLLDAIQYDAIAVFFAWVICRETAVIGWMPVLRGKNQLEASLQLMAFGMSGTVRAGADNAAQVCSEQTLRGLYLFDARGWNIVGGVAQPKAIVEGIDFKGDGTLVSPFATVSINGTIIHSSGSVGSYTVEASGQGTLTFTGGASFDIFVEASGQQVWMIQTDSNTVFQGTATKVPR
jgi:hypothetical protein